MKRFLFLSMVLGLFAGQASAAMYQLDAPLARQFTQLSAVSTGNDLYLSIDSPGTAGSTTYVDDGILPDYGETMQLAVGFVGSSLLNNIMTIGTTNPGGLGAYDGFGAWLANDDDDPWDVQLFVSYDGLATKTTSGWTTLSGYSPVTGPTMTFLSMGSIDFSTLTDLGFEVTGPRSVDVFHVSVVPVPAAVLLGLLGLGVAGWKLRRFA